MVAATTRNAVFILCSIAITSAQLFINTTGCGEWKACLFKPPGCDPNLDCTTSVILHVTGENELKMQMTAASLIPRVEQQYIAVAFSHDKIMGNDSVSECVLSDMGQFAGYEPEVFVSFNKGKRNDRVFLNRDEARTLHRNINSHVVDGRLMCEFTQQIVPQIDRRNNQIWNLDREFYLLVATGSSQPDEVNPHDMTRGSLFYPIISNKKFNPSKLTNKEFRLPNHTHTVMKTTTQKPQEKPTERSSAVSPMTLSLAWLASFIITRVL